MIQRFFFPKKKPVRVLPPGRLLDASGALVLLTGMRGTHSSIKTCVRTYFVWFWGAWNMSSRFDSETSGKSTIIRQSSDKNPFISKISTSLSKILDFYIWFENVLGSFWETLHISKHPRTLPDPKWYHHFVRTPSGIIITLFVFPQIINQFVRTRVVPLLTNIRHCWRGFWGFQISKNESRDKNLFGTSNFKRIRSLSKKL